MNYQIFNYIVKKASQTCSACGGTGKMKTPQPQPATAPKQSVTPRSASEVWAATPKGTKVPEGFQQWTGDGYEGWYSRDLGNGKTMMLSQNNIKNRRGGMIIDTPGVSPSQPRNTKTNTAGSPVRQQPTYTNRTVYSGSNNTNRRRPRSYTTSYNKDPRYAGLDHNAIIAMSRGSYAQGRY